MRIKWFDAKEAIEFGNSIAEYYAKRIPPEFTPIDVNMRKKLVEVMAKLHTQTEHFRRERQLNVYKTAKLANSFKWKLLDLGYNKALVEELTQELLHDS